MLSDTIISIFIAYLVGLGLYGCNELNKYFFSPRDGWQPQRVNVMKAITNVLLQILLVIGGLALIAFIHRWVNIPPGGAVSVMSMGCGFATCQLLEKNS
ncbi:hypothetical protein ACWU4D_17965 [Vibrio sp. WJH972]